MFSNSQEKQVLRAGSSRSWERLGPGRYTPPGFVNSHGPLHTTTPCSADHVQYLKLLLPAPGQGVLCFQLSPRTDLLSYLMEPWVPG